jgi:hypothetical protein
VTIAEMITKVKSRTKQVSSTVVIEEIQTAYDWVHNRIFNTEKGPNLYIILDEEIAISALTRSFDLQSNLGYTMLAIKQLWAMLPGDSVFTPMIEADTNDPDFISVDSQQAADSTVFAQAHPVYWNSINYNQVYFAPALPNGTKVRVDYYRFAGDPDDSGDQLDEIVDLPAPTHEAVCAFATGLVFDNLDDDRSVAWEARAKELLQDALYTLNRRVQQPTVTRPFQVKRRRYI